MSGDKLATQTRTNWPTPSVILIFLPQFKLVTKEYLQSKYEFNGVIARGAFGVVHRVTDVQEKQKYALKVLSKAQVSFHDEFHRNHAAILFDHFLFRRSFGTILCSN